MLFPVGHGDPSSGLSCLMEPSAGWTVAAASCTRRTSAELEPIRFIGTITNITDRVEAAEAMQASLVEKETLLREIHHRVKNNLQTLLALLQMEKRQIRDPALASRFDAMRSRIQVMAGIHENLYSSDGLSAVNMGKQMTASARACGNSARD